MTITKSLVSIFTLAVSGGLAYAQPADDAPVPEPPPTETTTQTTTTPAPSTTYNTQTNTYAPAPSTAYATSDGQEESIWKRYGMSISAGGGVEDFTNRTLRDATKIGGNWDVRVTFGTREPLAIEASYIGSAQSIDAIGLDSSAILVGNGAQGVLRLNVLPNMPIQPFIFGGVGWRHYNIANESFNRSDIRNKDDVMEFPVGLGFGYRMSGFLLDVRGEFRPTIFADLAPAQGDVTSDAEMHRWGVNATIGYEF